MNNRVSLKTAICMQYEILPKECQAALNAWDDSALTGQSTLTEKEVGG